MYEENAKMAGHATLGNGNHNRSLGAQGAPKDAPASLVQTERLFAGLSELHVLVNRLAAVIDRVSGPTPACENTGDKSPPSNLSDRLDYAAAIFSGQIGQLRQEIDRLERFV